MSKIKDGGPAFPQPDLCHDSDYGESLSGLSLDYECAGGMSLRDYFAAKAMQSIISNLSNFEILTAHTEMSSDCGLTNDELTASISYQLAEAMLRERGK